MQTHVTIPGVFESCRVSEVEEELSALQEEKERQLRQLKMKMDQSSQSLQHQHNIQEAKVGSTLYMYTVASL